MVPLNVDFAEERMLDTPISDERHSRARAPAVTGTARSTRVILVVLLPMVGALASCQDARSPTAPVPDAQPTAAAVAVMDLQQGFASGQGQTGPVSAAVAIEDALERVLPAVEAGGSTEALDAGLRKLLSQLEGAGSAGLVRALTEVRKAVDKYQARAGEEYQADIGVVQLALDAVANR